MLSSITNKIVSKINPLSALKRLSEDAIRLAYIALLLLSSITFTATAQQPKILIVFQSAQGFNQQLIHQIDNDLSATGQQVKRMHLGDTPLLIESMEDNDLLIAIGSKTTKQLLDAKLTTPILSVLMPRHLADSLHELYPEKHNWSSLLIDQPVERHFHLMTSILGKHQQAGILLGPYTENMKQSLQKAAAKTHHKITTEHIEDSEQLTASLNALNHRSNVLLTLPDPVIFNQKTIRGILLSSYRSKLPIIGFSQAYVKAGAIAAVYSQPGQISKQVVNLVDSFLLNNTFKRKTYYPKEFSVALNNKVARSLGIHLEASSVIINRIKRAENK